MTLVERFKAARIFRPGSDCWYWANAISRAGYGFFCIDGKNRYAHRFAYEYYVGPIPAGLEIDHLCRKRCCVNPDHLEAVTARVNVRRGSGPPAINAVKTHCSMGHPYTPENTYWTKVGARKCIACDRRRAREYQRNKK